VEPKDDGPRWVLALSSVVSFMVSLDSQVVATLTAGASEAKPQLPITTEMVETRR
jgi:hypothetical protein